MTATLRETPCARCGCHMAARFDCNCGAIHSDVCENCGRSFDCAPDRFLELSDVDVPCTRGPVAHEHPAAERTARVDAFFARVKAQRRPG